MRISKEFRFEASHFLLRHPGKCRRLHGHSWVFTVSVDGDRNPDTGFVMDYADIKKTISPLIDQLDHKHLGAFFWDEPQGADLSPGDRVLIPEDWRAPLPHDFYPSSENLIWWLAGKMAVLDSYRDLEPGETVLVTDFVRGRRLLSGWSELRLNETCTSSCILTRDEYDRKVGQR